jgi:NADPH-dependent ferric siderophore reductase
LNVGEANLTNMTLSNSVTEISSPFRFTPTPIPLQFRHVTLESREWITPHYVRVRLVGKDLTGFTSLGSDDHIRVFFPTGHVSSVEELRESPSREYTPLAWGNDWLDLEFAIHGDSGVAARWAASAPLGSPAGVGGPRGSKVLDGVPDSWFLAGDETAVPAIRRFCALMAPSATGRVLIEVANDANELSVDAPSGVSVEQVHRGEASAGSALAQRLDALTAEDRPAGAVLAFVAAEQSIVKSGRALLLERWALGADDVIVKGYWKRGEDEYHAPH